MTSPYLQRPKRSLSQVLADIGRQSEGIGDMSAVSTEPIENEEWKAHSDPADPAHVPPQTKPQKLNPQKLNPQKLNPQKLNPPNRLKVPKQQTSSATNQGDPIVTVNGQKSFNSRRSPVSIASYAIGGFSVMVLTAVFIWTGTIEQSFEPIAKSQQDPPEIGTSSPFFEERLAEARLKVNDGPHMSGEEGSGDGGVTLASGEATRVLLDESAGTNIAEVDFDTPPLFSTESSDTPESCSLSDQTPVSSANKVSIETILCDDAAMHANSPLFTATGAPYPMGEILNNPIQIE